MSAGLNQCTKQSSLRRETQTSGQTPDDVTQRNNELSESIMRNDLNNFHGANWYLMYHQIVLRVYMYYCTK